MSFFFLLIFAWLSLDKSLKMSLLLCVAHWTADRVIVSVCVYTCLYLDV